AAAALPTIDLSAARQVMEQHLPKLQDLDPQVRRAAAALLGALGPVAKPAVHSLIGVLDDPSTVVREQAVRALGSIGLPSDIVLRGLIQGLCDPEWTVRYAAVTQFSFNGFSSQESLAALRNLTKDSNQTVAGLAQSAVATAERLIQASVYALMLSQGMNRTYTLHQLAKLGPRAADAVSGIAAVLTSEKPLVSGCPRGVGLRLPAIYASHRASNQLCGRTAAGALPYL
ncbi:MAG: HEAT repeat domain-containing protein, partial [Nitrospiraceae bacterium]